MGMILVVNGFAQAFVDAGISKAVIAHQDTTKEQLSSLYWLNIVAGIVVGMTVLIARPLIVAYYQEPRLSSYLNVVAVGFVTNALGQQFRILMQKEMDFRALSIVETASSLIASVIAVVGAALGWGVWSLVLRSLVQTAVMTAASSLWAARRGNLPRLHFRWADLQGFVGFGLFQMGERAVNYLSANVDNLVIGRFLGAEALGYYSLAYQLIRFPLGRFNPIITQVAFPTFAKIQDNNKRLKRGYLKVVHYIASATFPMLLGMFVVAPVFVRLFYGSAWLPAVAIIRILCIVGMIKAQGNPMGSLLLSKGRADLGFYWNVFALVTALAANLIGVRWGIEGVAFSILAEMALIRFPASFYLRWLLVRMRALPYLNALRVPSIGSALMASALLALSPVWNQFPYSFVSLLCQVAIGILIYAGSLWFMDRPLCLEIRKAMFNRWMKLSSTCSEEKHART
jgi:O-antigen/teichoic acid export membrane protein